MENKTVIVIGAMNMDICGRPHKAPIMKDSNPGIISMSPGGVGRNIAHNLCLMGMRVKLVAAVGDDLSGESLYKSCAELGMDLHMCRRMNGGHTSTYMYISDERGDMMLAVSDMDISGSITPEYLSRYLGEINGADAVVIDGNLSVETIRWIADNVTAPLYADPVSVTKSERLKPALKKLRAFKPNSLEAMSMTGKATSLLSAEELVRQGVQRVFVSLGDDGIVAADGEEVVKLPCGRANIVNTTGCGDASTAAIVWADVNGLDLAETAAAAMAAAQLTIEWEGSVNPALCAELLI